MAEDKVTPDESTPTPEDSNPKKKRSGRRTGIIVAAIAVTAIVTAGITWLLTPSCSG